MALSDRVVVAEGKDIALVTIEREDTKVWNYISEPETQLYLSRYGYLSTPESTNDFYDSVCRNPDKLTFSIYSKPLDGVVGAMTLEVNRMHRHGYIGICIYKPKDCGHGIGTEALELLLDYAFNYLALHKVWLDVIADNERAVHIYRDKLGMRECGYQKEHYYRRGKWCDFIHFELLRSEYLAQNTAQA